MSYILEALKKSDQKHQLGTVPGLHTVHSQVPASGGGRKVWLLALVLVGLAVNAGVVGWWLWSGRGAAPMAVHAPEASVTPIPAAAAPEPLPVAPRDEVGQAEISSESAELMSARQEVLLARQEAIMARQEAVQVRQAVATAPTTPVGVPPNRGVAVPEPTPASAVSEPLATVAKSERSAAPVGKAIEAAGEPLATEAETATEEADPAPAEDIPLPALPAPKVKSRVLNAADDDPLVHGMGVVAIEEPKEDGRQPSSRAKKAAKEPEEYYPGLNKLSEAVRSTIPPISISFHSFSAIATSSLVRINGKILREGDSLEPGLKLEKITTTGVIFSIKGEQFQVTMH